MGLKLRKGDVIRLSADPAAALVVRDGLIHYTGARGGGVARAPDGAVDFAAGGFPLAIMADGTLLQLGVSGRWERIGVVPDRDEVMS